MLTASYDGPLGITPQERGRLQYEQRQRRRASQVRIGPFTFKATGSTVRVPGRMQPLAKLPRVWIKWLKRAVTKTSAKYPAFGGGMTMMSMPHPYFKGWGRVAPLVAIGKVPVAKILNPQDKSSNWGLYVKLGQNKLTEVTFKKVPRSDWGFLGNIGSGIASAVGAVVDGANAAGSAVVDGIKLIPRAVGAAAGLACDVVTHPSTQQAAALAQNVPNPYAQGAAIGAKIGAGICSAARGNAGGQPTPPTTATPVTPPVTPTAPKPLTIAQRLPPGSIQAQLPGTDKWAYAIPEGATLLPATTLSGLGFISPWSGRDFVSPFVRAPLDQIAQEQYSWWDVNTADSPYLAAWGLAAMTLLPTTGEKSDKATVVDAETLKKKTTPTPVYKKWWFWVVIAGGTAALGTGGYLVFRRK